MRFEFLAPPPHRSAAARRSPSAWPCATMACAVVDQVALIQRVADRIALRRQKGVGHGAADHQHVDLVTRFSSSAILVETLAPPTTASSGRCGSSSAFSRWSVPPPSRARHRPAAMREAFGRGMGAMRGGEGVVDEDVAERARARSAKAASFFSSPGWKRVFSSSSTSPSFIAATASCASGPMQSSAKATGRPITSASGGRHRLQRQRRTALPFGRSKWESTITLPPLSAISRMVGAWRSMRGVIGDACRPPSAH